MLLHFDVPKKINIESFQKPFQNINGHFPNPTKIIDGHPLRYDCTELPMVILILIS